MSTTYTKSNWIDLHNRVFNSYYDEFAVIAISSTEALVVFPDGAYDGIKARFIYYDVGTNTVSMSSISTIITSVQTQYLEGRLLDEDKFIIIYKDKNINKQKVQILNRQTDDSIISTTPFLPSSVTSAYPADIEVFSPSQVITGAEGQLITLSIANDVITVENSYTISGTRSTSLKKISANKFIAAPGHYSSSSADHFFYITLGTINNNVITLEDTHQLALESSANYVNDLTVTEDGNAIFYASSMDSNYSYIHYITVSTNTISVGTRKNITTATKAGYKSTNRIINTVGDEYILYADAAGYDPDYLEVYNITNSTFQFNSHLKSVWPNNYNNTDTFIDESVRLARAPDSPTFFNVYASGTGTNLIAEVYYSPPASTGVNNISIGSLGTANFYVGSSGVVKIYIGGTIVYEV